MVKEKVFGGLSIVWLFHPDDIKTLFENEGKYPSRRSHLALKKYRKEKPEFYNNGGLLPTNGPEWARMRKAAQKPLTKQLLSNHIQAIDEASLDFVDVLMAKIKTSPEITDMLEELKKFFAEVTGIVLFGLRLGAIQENLESCSEIATLMSEVEKINDRILQTDGPIQSGPIYPKDAYLKIKESQVNGKLSLILAL